MKTHNLVQGSEAWHAYRAKHFNASDAPAMMGCSPYRTRTELLRKMHTGIEEDIDASKQRIFDEGHRAEGLARTLAEEICGEELYPVVGSIDEYSASFDGLTMDQAIAFEHKSLNAELRTAIVDEACGYLLPMQYRVQMEQQLMVAGAERCLFMASKWDGDELVEERHTWYYPDFDLRAKIEKGWKQFKADLATYVPPQVVEVKPVGRTPETLPALHVEVTGMVTASNLAAYKEHALAVFDGINRDLKTEQEFADAERIVKWCGDVESRLEAAKQHALSQTQSIDELFKTMDDIKEVARRTRLDLDKLIVRRKDEIRAEIVTVARAAYSLHVMELDREIFPISISLMSPDFAAAIKGKRSLESMRDAVDVALANGKIAADAQAKHLRANLATFKEKAAGYEFLFADQSNLMHKSADDLILVIESRIEKRKASEAEAKAQAEAKFKTEAQAVAKEIDSINSPAIPETIVAHVPPRSVPTSAPTLKLGDISGILGFNLTADFLRSLGFEPALQVKNAMLYHEQSFPAICQALVRHIQRVAKPLAA